MNTVDCRCNAEFGEAVFANESLLSSVSCMYRMLIYLRNPQ